MNAMHKDFSVTDLAVARGGIPVLERVSFTVAPGAALILRGPNGIGKTTLLRCLAGLQPPLAGTINIAAEDIAYASHADGLKSTLSVAENLRFWAQVYGTSDISQALENMNLAPLADRPAHALSAGQKRRLGLARMLVTGRSLWAMDEPTVSLDAASTALFAAAIKTHLRNGGTAIIATHIDLGFDAEILDLTDNRAAPDSALGFDEAFL